MFGRLGHHVNKSVLVSSPQIFANADPHHCRLIGIEPAGLWLESEDLSRIVFPDARAPPATVFVPFAQIVYLVGMPIAPSPGNAHNEKSRSERKPRGATPGKARR